MTVNLTKQKGQPTLPDIQLLLAAGINPYTGEPIKMSGTGLQNDLKRLLRIVDEQQAINRIVWEETGARLSSIELERLIYFKYNLVFFYLNDEFYYMPYALDGTIDFYGRFNDIHPVPYAFGLEDKAEEEKLKNKAYKTQSEQLAELHLKVVKSVEEAEELKNLSEEELKKYCVIVRDYSPQISQNGIPRWVLNEKILDLETECICLLKTSLVVGSGVSGVRVNDADQQQQVNIASRIMEKNAVAGNPWLAIVGSIEFQELTGSKLTPASEFFMAFQSIDNLRLSTYGIENGGVYEKQAHILESENEVNANNKTMPQNDSYMNRQQFSEIANILFEKLLKGKKISVKIGESIGQTLGGAMQERNIKNINYEQKEDVYSGGEE